MTPSKCLIYVCLSFILGLILNLLFPSLAIWVFLILGTALISIFWKKRKIVFWGFCCFFISLGFFYQISGFDSIEEIEITGKIIEEPQITRGSDRLRVKTEKGIIYIITEKYSGYNYGDMVSIKGKFSENSFMFMPKIDLIGKEEGFFYVKILNFRSSLREIIKRNIPLEEGIILRAMIIGDKSGISGSFGEKLNNAGIRHITAVSGMHIIVLSGILISFFMLIGMWRSHAFYLSCIIIFMFIALTGFQPSAIRAGIMGGILLLAERFGRKSSSIRIIIFTGTLMLLFSPSLVSSIGFQLSFSAVLGIVYLSPLFKRFFSFLGEKISDIVSTSFSAQIFTFPFLIYHFGSFPSSVIFSNILVIPVLYFVMLFGILFVLISYFFPFLSFILSLPCVILLLYITKIIDIFSSFPAINIINVQLALVIYFVFLIFLFQINQKIRYNQAI